jgi:FtsZ-interacting cell division protein ZipA
MPGLREALIGVSLLILAGLALWEWRKSRRRFAPHDRVEPAVTVEPAVERMRREPRFDDIHGMSAADPDESLEVPTIHPVEPVLVGVVAESAVDIPAAARFQNSPAVQPEAVPADVVIQWPPVNAGRVVSLRVVSAKGEPLSGRALRTALEALGLRHGPQNIYHRVTATGAVLVSAANLMRPGNLDPELMDTQVFRGVNLFSVLPGALPPAGMLDELVAVARNVAQRLSAVVQDEKGAYLDSAKLGELRRSLTDESTGTGQ